MTPQQEKAISRCKAMLKLAFPELTGHLEFHMKVGMDKVKCHVRLENQ